MTIEAYQTPFSYCNPYAAVAGAGEAAPPSSASSALLTPDALMAYCESRLGSIDSQMDSIFQAQESYNKLTTDIDSLASNLNQYESTGIGTGPGDQTATTAFTSANNSLNQLISEANTTDPQVASELQGAMNTLNNGGDTFVSTDEITNIEKTLQQASSDVGAGAELNMINLQSLMSQRQTAIQLTTNLVQSMGDQMNAIATNIGK
jgi:hypothetical protein